MCLRSAAAAACPPASDDNDACAGCGATCLVPSPCLLSSLTGRPAAAAAHACTCPCRVVGAAASSIDVPLLPRLAHRGYANNDVLRSSMGPGPALILVTELGSLMTAPVGGMHTQAAQRGKLLRRGMRCLAWPASPVAPVRGVLHAARHSASRWCGTERPYTHWGGRGRRSCLACAGLVAQRGRRLLLESAASQAGLRRPPKPTMTWRLAPVGACSSLALPQHSAPGSILAPSQHKLAQPACWESTLTRGRAAAPGCHLTNEPFGGAAHAELSSVR